MADGPDLLQKVKEGAQRLDRFLIRQTQKDVALGRSADVGDGWGRGNVGDPSCDRDAEGGSADARLQMGFEDFEGVIGQRQVGHSLF